MTDFTLHTALDGDDLDAVRALCWAYRDFLLSLPGVSAEVTDAFNPATKYEALMTRLPQLHARPRGTILLARDVSGTPMGCGMSHPLDDKTSEIKRVFVTDAARGKGVAESLCTALVTQAAQDGFSRVVLDTHKLLTTAQRLYLRLGFIERGPYQEIPKNVLHELVFFEKNLVA
jgi:putative acetyltransferase